MQNNHVLSISKQHSNKKSWILINILSIILIILLIFAVIKTQELNKSQDTLSITKSQLSTTQAELTDTKAKLLDTQAQLIPVQTQLTSSNNKLVSTQTQLTLTQGQLADTQTQLTSTKGQLADTQTQLTSTKEQLADTQTQLTSTKGQLADKQTQLTSAQGQLTSTQTELKLYKDTWGSVVASGVKPPFQDAGIVNQPTATNPTSTRLQDFILSDKTDRNPYIPGIYTCGEYARDVHNKAEQAGIRAAYVAIELTDTWHACNAFKTTDNGLVFFDCTGLPAGENGPSSRDKAVYVKLGREYIPRSLDSQPGWKDTWQDMGEIYDVQVYW